MNSVFFTNVNFLQSSRKQSLSYHFRPTSSFATKFLLPILNFSPVPRLERKFKTSFVLTKNSTTKNRLFWRRNKMDKFRRSPMKSSSLPGFTARRIFLLQLDKFFFFSFSISFRFWFDFVRKAFLFTRKFLDFSQTLTRSKDFEDFRKLPDFYLSLKSSFFLERGNPQLNKKSACTFSIK